MRFQDFENGVMEYINTEFCSRLDDWRKWMLPLAAGYAKPWAERKYLDNMDTLKMVGLVSEDGEIDIDTLYNRLSEIARKSGSVKWSMPMMGEVTFHSEDIDKLYHILRR